MAKVKGGAQSGGPDRKVKEYLEAAAAAREKGETDRALDFVREAASRMFRSGRRNEAIDLATQERDYATAAGFAEKMKEYKRAAQLWFRGGDFLRAAEARLQNKEPLLAAELFERVGEHSRAAELYESAGDFVRASSLYERSGAKQRAADLLMRALSSEGRRLVGQEADEACRRAGILYAEVGHVEFAVRVLRWGGQTSFAGQVLARSGRVEEAMDLLAEAGDYLAAADLARATGNERRAQILWAMRDEKEGRFSEAAARFEQAELNLEAARLYEYANQPVEAAESYERGGQLDTARQLYEQLGRVQDAARCLRNMGREAEAMALLEGAKAPDDDAVRGALASGDFLRAAGIMLSRARRGERGYYQEALVVLNQIGRERPDYFASRTLAAEILSDESQHQLAISILQEALSGIPVGREHLPAIYQYGRLLELSGYLAQAREAYRVALTIDPNFRDIAQRMQFLRGTDSSARLAVRMVPGTPVPTAPLIVGSAVAPPPSSSFPPAQPKRTLPPPPPPRDPIEELAEALLEDAERLEAEEKEEAAKKTKRPSSLVGVILRSRFRIEKRIGRGAQAEVYLARDLVLDRPVAIKVLNASVAEDERALDRFLREARLAARVHHPSCIAIFDFGQESGLTFMAMEYFKGQTLRERLKGGPIPPKMALRIAIDIADALVAVHRAGIVHRDVKPTNVMVDASGSARLTDFGVAKAAADEGTSHASGLMVGTMKYMSPEQARGKDADGRSDIFALGVVIFEMISGKAPFGGTLDALIKRVTDPPPKLSEDAPVPESVRKIVHKCMQRKPDARYPSVERLASELRAALMAMEEDSPAEVTDPQKEVPTERPAPRTVSGG